MTKNRIITAFEESEETRLRRLLQCQHLKKKLSYYLQDLGRVQCERDRFKTLFLEQFSGYARCVLTVFNKDTELDKLTEVADRIAEIQHLQAIMTVQQSATSLPKKIELSYRTLCFYSW